MDEMRKPFLVLALILITLAVLIEIGAVGFIGGAQVSDTELRETVRAEVTKTPLPAFPPLTPAQQATARETIVSERVALVKETQLEEGGSRPGIGIPYLGLVDAVVLFTAGLIGAGLFLKQSTQARVQGCATLIFSIILLLTEIVLLIVAITLLFFIIGTLAAGLFPPLVYIALFAFFDVGGALITLSLLLLLKLGFGGSLIAAQQGFLKNKGLVLLVATALLANIIVMILHGIVPRFFASITDAIAGIVVAIIALIWTIILLFGSIFSVLKALKPS